MEYDLLNGLTLAYVGDGYYEIEIRKYLINKNLTKVDQLHKSAILYTSAKGQSKAFEELNNEIFFTDEEIGIFKRARNKCSNINRRNVTKKEYSNATGFEAIIGYLYLKNDFDRLNIIIKNVIKKINC